MHDIEIYISQHKAKRLRIEKSDSFQFLLQLRDLTIIIEN